MQTDFRKYYNTLNLEPGADWSATQKAYRRLVNEWHPDRHNRSPADNQKAQAYFIELTRSYDALRKFHRQNKRMPLSMASGSAAAQAQTGVAQDESLLNRARKREMKSRLAKRRNYKRLAIIYLGVGFCLSVLVFLFTLDRQFVLQAGEDAKRELKNSTPSPYLPAPGERGWKESSGAARGNLFEQGSDGIFNE